jgi:hypothetical protein
VKFRELRTQEESTARFAIDIQGKTVRIHEPGVYSVSLLEGYGLEIMFLAEVSIQIESHTMIVTARAFK